MLATNALVDKIALESRALGRLSIPSEFDTYHFDACNHKDRLLSPILFDNLALGNPLPSIRGKDG